MSKHDAELIASLREIGTQSDALTIEVDTTFVDAVIRRVRSLPSPRARRRRRVLRRGLAALTAMFLVVVPGPRQAFARWLGIGSVRITNGQVPSGLPPAIRELNLGEPATPKAGVAIMKHPIWKPQRGVPLGIWIEPNRPMVNSVYRVDGHDVLISELPGPSDVYVLKKTAAQGSPIDFLQVRGETAAWISGHPHEIAMIGPSGLETVAVRLAGNVLIWADQTRTIRIEGLENREDATALLESLGP